MSLEGRSQKRTLIAIPVYLRRDDSRAVVERSVTVNLSSRGARIRTNRRWEPESEPHLVSLTGNPVLRARVVYCHAADAESFYVGLKFPANLDNWRGALG